MSKEFLRYLDGYEIGVIFCWLKIEITFCTDAELCVVDFKNAFSKFLKEYPSLNLVVDSKPGEEALGWFYDESDLKDEYFNLNATSIERKLEDLPSFSDSLIQLDLVELSKKEYQIQLYLNHILCDGKNVFETLKQYLAYLFQDQATAKPQIVKYPLIRTFGQYELFSEEYIKKNTNPDTGKFIIQKPELYNLVSRNKNLYPLLSDKHKIDSGDKEDAQGYNFIYKKVQRKKNFSGQVIISSAVTSAILLRKKNQNTSSSFKVSAYIPTDLRRSPYTSELNKENNIFCSAAAAFPTIEVSVEDSFETVAEKWKDALKAALSTECACYQVFSSVESFEVGENGKLINKGNSVSNDLGQLICGSHIGVSPINNSQYYTVKSLKLGIAMNYLQDFEFTAYSYDLPFEDATMYFFIASKKLDPDFIEDIVSFVSSNTLDD